MIDGYNWRKEQQENIMAYFTMNMMNPHLRESITVAELLEPIRGTMKARRQEDEEFLREEFKHILGGGGAH